MDKNKLNAIVTIIFLFTLLMSVVAGITTISNGESILGGGINTTTINANQVLVNGTAVSLTDTDTNTNVTSIQVTGTTTKTLNVEQTGLTNLTATWSDINTFNSSDDIKAVYYPTLSTYPNLTSIDTQGEVETIWGVTLATDTELSAYTTTSGLYGLLGTYLNSSTAGTTYQPLEATLTDIADGTIVEELIISNEKKLIFADNYWGIGRESNPTGATTITSAGLIAKVYGDSTQGFMIKNHNNLSLFEVSGDGSKSYFAGDVLLNTGIDLNISTTGQINWNSSIYEYINASGCLIRVVGTTRVNQCP